jgi:hypothetical protein
MVEKISKMSKNVEFFFCSHLWHIPNGGASEHKGRVKQGARVGGLRVRGQWPVRALLNQLEAKAGPAAVIGPQPQQVGGGAAVEARPLAVGQLILIKFYIRQNFNFFYQKFFQIFYDVSRQML